MNAWLSFLQFVGHPPAATRPHMSQTSSGHPVQRAWRLRSHRVWLLLMCAAILCLEPCSLRAQDSEGDNPTGPAGDYNGEVTTAGSYDAYTQNAKRSITDLTVPGSNGTYPLAFTRTYNSAGFATTTDAKCFGDGGNWRHSYLWLCTPTEASGVNATAFEVFYPDGATVVFRPNRATTPAGENADYWRGPVGTQDRLEVANPNLQPSSAPDRRRDRQLYLRQWEQPSDPCHRSLRRSHDACLRCQRPLPSHRTRRPLVEVCLHDVFAKNTLPRCKQQLLHLLGVADPGAGGQRHHGAPDGDV